MSVDKITFQGIDRVTFDAVEQKLLTTLGGVRPAGSDSDIELLGIRGTLAYDEKQQAATVALGAVPAPFTGGNVIGWLHSEFGGEGLYWDVLTFTIVNNASFDIDVSNVPNMTHGEWGDAPASVSAGTTAESFEARSVGGAEIAPAGSVTYGMADGTTLNVNFDMQFDVGQQSTFTASLGGTRAGSYGLQIGGHHSSWHGMGTRWPVTLTVNAGAGDTSVELSYTR